MTRAINPLNWSLLKKWMATFMCALIAIARTVPSSIERAKDVFDTRFGVNIMAGSVTTGMLINLHLLSTSSSCFARKAQAQHVLPQYV